MKRKKMLGVRLARAVPSGRATLRIAFLVVIAALAVTGAQAQMTIKAIYDFSNTSGPLDPQLVGVFAQGRDGNMWSTAPKGGKNGIGAAFKITPGGKLTDVHDFDPSKGEGTSYSGLTLGTDGDFYGTLFGRLRRDFQDDAGRSRDDSLQLHRRERRQESVRSADSGC